MKPLTNKEKLQMFKNITWYVNKPTSISFEDWLKILETENRFLKDEIAEAEAKNDHDLVYNYRELQINKEIQMGITYPTENIELKRMIQQQ